jgi:hypothetical protein
MKRYRVRFMLWPSGAYAISSFDPRRRVGALVESNGKDAVHVVIVDKQGVEERVVKRRAARGVPGVGVSTRRADAGGSVDFEWSVHRAGLERRERWQLPQRGRGKWQQIDRRPRRTTTYRSKGGGRFHGKTVGPDRKLLWTSEWTRDVGGLTGRYFDPAAKPIGKVTIKRPRGAAGDASWDGPASTGALEVMDRRIRARIEKNGGVRMVTLQAPPTGSKGGEKTGSSRTESSSPDEWWAKIRAYDPNKPGESEWWSEGRTKTPSGRPADYTGHGTDHSDGSGESSYDITTDIDRTTLFGDKGPKSGDGEGQPHSESQRIVGDDGTITIVIHTEDKDGDGTEEVIKVDKYGRVISERTYDVKGHQRVGNGRKGGIFGYDDGGGSDDDPGSGDDPGDDEGDDDDGEDDDGTDGDDDPGDDSGGDPDDPNDPSDPDQPESPDSGGEGSGMPSDDGTDDRAPEIPLGAIGRRHGAELGKRLREARDGDAGDGGGAPDSAAEWRGQLLGMIRAGRGGSKGRGPRPGGGADETGWGSGSGNEGPPEHGMPTTGGLTVPASADDSGWGDLVNPRALVGFVTSVARATGAVSSTAFLLNKLRR